MVSTLFSGYEYYRKQPKMNVLDGPRRIFAISILKPDNNSGVEGLVKLL